MHWEDESDAKNLTDHLKLFPESLIHLWGAAASWLAHVWDASGHPMVSLEDWENAVKQSSPC